MVTCQRALELADNIRLRPRTSVYDSTTRTMIAGMLERHYRKECVCFGATDDTVGLTRPMKIDWEVFDDA